MSNVIKINLSKLSFESRLSLLKHLVSGESVILVMLKDSLEIEDNNKQSLVQKLDVGGSPPNEGVV